MAFDEGAYVFFDGDDACLFMYVRLSPDALRRALPMDNTDGSTHIGTVFVPMGDTLYDYVGPMTLEMVQTTLRSTSMTHIDHVDQRHADVRELVELAKSKLPQRPHPHHDGDDDTPTGC